jgi:hypothetical protein
MGCGTVRDEVGIAILYANYCVNYFKMDCDTRTVVLGLG